jgi:hypothetical protein
LGARCNDLATADAVGQNPRVGVRWRWPDVADRRVFGCSRPNLRRGTVSDPVAEELVSEDATIVLLIIH